MTLRITYLRPTRLQSPTGCVAYQYNGKDNTVSYQVSVLNPTFYEVPGKEITVKGAPFQTRPRQVRDEFNRVVARDSATSKLKSDPITVALPALTGETCPSSWDVTAAVMADISLSKNLPGRASRIAGEWMVNNGFKKVNKSWVKKPATAAKKPKTSKTVSQ